MKSRSLLPHSWSVDNWPPDVFPNTTPRGRYVLRMHRRELQEAKALTRVGRQIVVLGQPYEGWLQRQASRLADYSIPPNNMVKRDSQNEAA